MHKFGRHMLMTWFVKGFGEQVRRLVDKRNKANLMTSKSILFADKVIIQLNVTCVGMENWIGSHVCGAEIVTKELDREPKTHTQFMEEVEPSGFGTSMREGRIF
ncbi:hypothetical protein L3X38_024313 [Prunus dulcis]|uniref:Uncharacterized protein n=1 Tax=Prunus dulcis TaxID=3755 RepID=A0AAD4Z616_PRUDU|nr:hypothetical protein L3X38_024313 [Prunus dulcis]